VNPEGLWHFGSQAKSLLTTVIFQLADEKKISLDDPISKYLDPIENVDGNLTIRQLLNHTSGLGEYWDSSQPTWGVVFSTRDSIWNKRDLLAYIPEGNPSMVGTHDYTNTNFLLIDLIVEEVTGKMAHVAIKERIFDTVQMPESYIAYDDFSVNAFNGIWNYNSGNPFYAGNLDNHAYLSTRVSWIGTLMETCQFYRAMNRGELFSSEGWNEMFVDAPGSVETVTTPPGNTRVSYGLGNSIAVIDGENCHGHGGTGISQSGTYHNRDRNVTIGIAGNVFGARDETNYIWFLVFDAVREYLDSQTNLEDGLSRESAVKIYPNPANDRLIISMDLRSSGAISAGLYDLSGRLLEELIPAENVTGNRFESEIYLGGGYQPGIYLLKIQTPDGIRTEQLILK
jgi:CubicO group peptidase (beta-lactamase class C family)